jgi:phosphoglycolate phosphatase
VIFDWDGTLIDSTAVITESIRSAARDLGLPVPTRQQASYVIGMGLHEALAHTVPGLKPSDLQAFVERYRVHYMQFDAQILPFDGIPELLETLHRGGVPLAVATGKSRRGLDRALEQTGWGALFTETRCADEGEPKPSAWLVNDLCEACGWDATRVVVVGDTTHDLGMAKNAGARAIGVAYGAHDPEALRLFPAWKVVQDVAELGTLLIEHTSYSSKDLHG